jgi:hypothetical protein
MTSRALQNFCVLPEDPKNLEILLRDVDAKGNLDIELVFRLRQKESLGPVKQKILRKIQQNESDFHLHYAGSSLAFKAL